MKFSCTHTDGEARRGRLEFKRGSVQTPAFMPVGTYGTVKAMTPDDVLDTGAEIVLGNTFHLMLRPGTDIIQQHGTLHDFMQWEGPILTDSGGFQVFSLGELRKITEEGVAFNSPVNGDRVFLGPEESMQVQRALGADIVMIFDECTPYPATETEARARADHDRLVALVLEPHVAHDRDAGPEEVVARNAQSPTLRERGSAVGEAGHEILDPAVES